MTADQQTTATPKAGGKVVRIRRDKDQPRHRVNVTFGGTSSPYRYSIGDDGHDRAIYQRSEDEDGTERWVFRAPLPYVHARVVRRDGSQRRIGTDYLISMAPDAPGVVTATRVLVTDQDLADGAWAIKVGANLSSDRNIITAAGTALRDVAYRDAPEREAVARPDVHAPTGHVDLPVSECLPDGYLSTPPLITADEARQVMREVIAITAANPKMALTLGASCGAPFVGPLRRQSHWWDLYGDARRGKSTTLAVAASVWGDPRIGTGIVLGWDASKVGSGRHLGQLGILPALFDERGLADRDRAEWGELIYATCQGSSRLTAEVKTSGTRRSAPWFGVLFSTGNARLTDGIAAGRFAGIPARVIELGTPLTRDKTEAKRLTDELLPRCYGWLGAQLLTTYTVPRVRELLADAEAAVGCPAGGTPGTLAEHLHLAVVGAMMADAIVGTGTALTDAATAAARDYLEMHGHEPEHDADRMLDALAESLVARRPAWPTEAEYLELGEPGERLQGTTDPARAALAQHGYDRELFGIRSDDGDWLYVMPSTWAAIAEELGVDSSVACTELHRRGHLHVPKAARTKGEWQAQARILPNPGKPRKKVARVYQVSLAAIERDDQDDTAAPPPPPPPAPTVTPTASAPAGPCEQCQRPGEWCGYGIVTADRQPCACGCGASTLLRSACGAARIAHGADDAQRPAPAPAAPAPHKAPEKPHKAARTGKATKRAEVLAEAKAVLDKGGDIEDMMRALHTPRALEKSHAPMFRGDDGRMHYPYWRPELPGMLDLAHVIASGWSWRRDYDGPTIRLDKSGAWVAAGASVEVARDALEHTGEIEFEGRPGYYLVDVYPWTETGMPHPLNITDASMRKVGEQIWVPAPTVALLQDLVEEGRWPDVTIADSYTSPGVRINEWTKHVNALRTYAVRTYGRDSDQYEAVKRSYGQTMSLMTGSVKENGIGRAWKFGIHRPDWTHAIQAHAAAMLWRRADQCRKVAPDLGPVAIEETDVIVIPEAAYDIVTTEIPPGRTTPVITIDPEGLNLRSFKVKAADEDEDQEQQS